MKTVKPGNQFIRKKITCLYLWKESTGYKFFFISKTNIFCFSVDWLHVLVENISGKKGHFNDAALVVLGIWFVTERYHIVNTIIYSWSVTCRNSFVENQTSTFLEKKKRFKKK